MGTVYEAEQESPHRTVALKIIRPGLATSEHLRRFELESIVLGRLQHSGIAQIFEAGTADTGSGTQPFFAMELIQGLPLLEHATKYELRIRERLQLVTRICDAVHHAHLRGIIHRDLKPGNILVTEPGTGGTGQPKILDFGVARMADADIQMTVHQTSTGQIIGTLPYMSPEQVSGDPDALDVRSDVYALGVLLYEILSGQMPLDLSKRQIPEAVRMIQEQEPSRLSRHDLRLRGDIEVIVTKALEKEKDRRYQSAEELADDLRRFLENRPIEARPPSTAYQLRKFARRNRALVGGVAAAFVLLTAGTVVSTWQAVRATRAENTAAEEAAASQRVSEFLADMLADLDPETMGNTLLSDLRERVVATRAGPEFAPEDGTDPGEQFNALFQGVNRADIARQLMDRQILSRAASTITSELNEDPLIAARLYQTLGDTYLQLGLYESAESSFEYATEIRVRELGAKSPEALSSRHGSALAHYRAASDGNQNVFTQDHAALQEDLDALAELYEDRRDVLGAQHPGTLESLAWVVESERRARRFETADSLQTLLLNATIRQLGREHPSAILAANCLGLIKQDLNDFAAAESLWTDAFEIARRVLGREDVITLRVARHIAILYDNRERYVESVALHEENVRIRERVQGREHEETLRDKEQVIHVYERHLYQLEEAAPIWEELIAARRNIWGPTDARTITTVLGLAALRLDLGQKAVADSLVDAVLADREAVYGERERETLRLKYKWYDALLRYGHSQEAARGLDRVLFLQRGLLEPSHQHFRHSLGRLGHAYESMDEFDRAEPIFAELLEIGMAADPSSIATQWNMAFLARVYRAQGRFDEAELLSREALALAEHTPGQNVWKFKLDLAKSLLGQGRLDEAGPYVEDYLETSREIAEMHVRYLNNHADNILNNVPEPFQDFGEALDSIIRACEATDYEDPDMLDTLAMAYFRVGRIEEAIDAQRKAITKIPVRTHRRAGYEDRLAEYEAALREDESVER